MENKKYTHLLKIIFVPLKDKKGITITKTFQEILDESGQQNMGRWRE